LRTFYFPNPFFDSIRPAGPFWFLRTPGSGTVPFGRVDSPFRLAGVRVFLNPQRFLIQFSSPPPPFQVPRDCFRHAPLIVDPFFFSPFYRLSCFRPSPPFNVFLCFLKFFLSRLPSFFYFLRSRGSERWDLFSSLVTLAFRFFSFFFFFFFFFFLFFFFFFFFFFWYPTGPSLFSNPVVSFGGQVLETSQGPPPDPVVSLEIFGPIYPAFDSPFWVMEC